MRGERTPNRALAGPLPPIIFAVEVRSESDYGSTAEQEMEQKRADYFAAGTLVVWDVEYYTRCFWYMRRDLEIGVGDIPEIARGLRLHGGRQGFILAARLCP